jgi:hypothetical protein
MIEYTIYLLINNYIELKGKLVDILVINCYVPTDAKIEEIKNAFYEELDTRHYQPEN